MAYFKEIDNVHDDDDDEKEEAAAKKKEDHDEDEKKKSGPKDDGDDSDEAKDILKEAPAPAAPLPVMKESPIVDANPAIL
jgi:hypothetical protein